MKKQIVYLLLLISVTPCLMAQKKEISQARSYIKSGSNLDKAENILKTLLHDENNKSNAKIYMLWYESVVKQYKIGNERLYLKQKYDTAQMYQQTKRMFEILMALDSVDSKPDEKGRVKTKYRKNNAEELDKLRPNLYFGGAYYLKKSNFNEAFNLYKLYLTTVEHPMFQEFRYSEKDTLIADAAYWATYSGFMQNNPQQTIMFSHKAIENKSKERFVLQYVAEAYHSMNDKKMYASTLRDGFTLYPAAPFFFSRLSDFYVSEKKIDKALALANEGLVTDSLNLLFLLSKSSLLLNSERYDECIETCDRMISVCDTIAQPYYNAGISYLNKTIEIDDSNDKSLKNKKMELYRKAMPYLEKYRALKPKDIDKWGRTLYTVYLNLNLGKQFDELDKLLNKESKKR